MNKHVTTLAILCSLATACVVQSNSGSELPANKNQQQQQANQPNPPLSGDPSTGDLLAFLPNDTSMIGGADFQKMRASSHYSKYRPMIEKELDREAVALFRDQCNIDVLEAAGWIVAAAPGDPNDEDRTAIVISSSVSWPQLHDCLDRMGMTFEQDGDISIYRHQNDVLYARWLSENTFMMTANPEARGIYDLAGTKTMDGTYLAGLLGEVDTTAMVWLAADTAKASQRMGPMGVPGAIGMFGFGELPGDFTARAGIIFDNPQTAKSTATTLAQQIDIAKAGMAGPFLRNIQLSVEGSKIMVDYGLSKSEVEMVLGMLGGAF